jgi:predicted  nucleic acid-binding Zn-ribbon protein
MQESAKKTLEMEMVSFKNENQKQRAIIFKMQQELQKYSVEAAEALSKSIQAEDEVKLRDIKIKVLCKRITETETRLKQQQNLYEAVQSDKNLYGKNLLEAQKEIQEMRRRFKKMMNEISQLKEEIQAKDNALMAVHLEHARLEKEREIQKMTIERLKNQLVESDNTCKSLHQEIKKLEVIIEKSENQNQIKSNQIKSDQIKSNQIKSN